MWKLDTGERIAHWRAFRKTLDTLTLDAALAETADFWHGCPFHPFYLDPDKPDTWPTPWELIAENYYCDLAKTLGILYTVCFTEHKKELDPEIRVYYDAESQHTFNLAVFAQGKYVLNFRDTPVVNITSINKNLILKQCYSSKELKLEEY
jgi:hypothetical protein